MSDSLRPHEPQQARPPCPSQTPGIYSDSCPSNRWCHPATSSSFVPFSSCPQSLPASGSFPMSQLFASGGQSTRVSALTSVLPMNTQDWSPQGWTAWISLQSQGLSRVLSIYYCNRNTGGVASEREEGRKRSNGKRRKAGKEDGKPHDISQVPQEASVRNIREH